MNIMQKHNGSITLMIIVLMTALSLIIYSIVHTSSYCISLAYKREEYEKQYQIAAALLEYAVHTYSTKEMCVAQDTQKVVLFQTTVPSDISHDSLQYHAVIQAERTKASITFSVDLTQQGKKVLSLSSKITQ